MMTLAYAAACCVLACLVAAAAGYALWSSLKKSDEPVQPSAPTEADITRELALSLASMIDDLELAPAAQTHATKGEFEALLLLSRRWKESGGKPKNMGQFNDLVRALEAITS